MSTIGTMEAEGIEKLPEKHLNHTPMNAVGLGPKPLSSRGVVALERAKAKRIVAPRRPDRIRKNSKAAKR
jgi:hypothetical protein